MHTLREFMRPFESESLCREFLINLRWPDGFCCPLCGSERYSYIQTRELFECLECRTQTSVTSGTMLHGTKIPLTHWMAAFYWISSGESCSARKLSIAMGLNYRTALRMMRIIRYEMRRLTGPHLITGVNGASPVKMSKSTGKNGLEDGREFSAEFSAELSCENRHANPARNESGETTGNLVKKAVSFMAAKSERFIRSSYKNVHSAYIQSYRDEYVFRWKFRLDGAKALSGLLESCCRLSMRVAQLRYMA